MGDEPNVNGVNLSWVLTFHLEQYSNSDSEIIKCVKLSISR